MLYVLWLGNVLILLLLFLPGSTKALGKDAGTDRRRIHSYTALLTRIICVSGDISHNGWDIRPQHSPPLWGIAPAPTTTRTSCQEPGVNLVFCVLGVGALLPLCLNLTGWSIGKEKSKSEVKRKGITNSICRAALPNKEDANEKKKKNYRLPHT